MLWVVTLTLIGMFALYIGLGVCYCKRCGRESDESSQALLEKADDEQRRPQRKKVDWRARYKLKGSAVESSESPKNNPFL